MGHVYEGCIIIFVTVFTLWPAVVYADGPKNYCEEAEIKACIQPTYNYLNETSAGHEHFLRTSLLHYMELLTGREHPNEIHMSSLDNIVLPLDKMIFEGSRHGELCRKWNATHTCLKPYIERCDNEVRMFLDGIVDVFQDICGPFATQILNAADPCILQDAVQANVMDKCMRVLNKTLSNVPYLQDCEPGSNENNTDINCEERAKSYTESLLRDGAVIPIDATYSHSVVAAQVCTAVDATLRCYKDQLMVECKREVISQKEYELRHKLVHWLLVDLDCEGIDGSFCNISEFGCSNGTCISGMYRCDGVKQCSDGGDEINCSTNSSMSVLSILLVIVLVIIVVVLAVACIIKIRQERHENHMYRAHRNSEEMEDVLQNEGSLGRSTPPHDYSSNGGDEFTFKSVKS